MTEFVRAGLRTRRGVLALALAAELLCLPGSALAWSTIGERWDDSEAVISLNLNDGTKPGADWDAEAEDALARWNQVSDSAFRFLVNHEDHDKCSQLDLANNVDWEHFSNGDGICDDSDLTDEFSGALAITRRVSFWDEIYTADVLFNSFYDWTGACRNHTTDSPYNLNSVAIHEFGHALGLEHEDRVVATMNSIYHANCRRIHANDKGGLRHLYLSLGFPSARHRDVGLTNWYKVTSSDREAARLVSHPSSVVAGQSFRVETVVENHGYFTDIYHLGWYLSSNSSISTADRPILDAFYGGWLPVAVSPETAMRWGASVTIPKTVTPGDYWIGAIVDFDNRIGEWDENNNSLALPKQIHVLAPTPTPTPIKTPTPTPTKKPTPTPTKTPTPTPTKTPIPVPTATVTDPIFSDGFEAGNLAAWFSAKTDGGDLSATGFAAMVGTKGLRAVLDDTQPLYVEDRSPKSEPRYRARFWLNAVDFASSDAANRTQIWRAISTKPDRLSLASLVIRRTLGTVELMARLRRDDGTMLNSGFVTLPPGPCAVELDWLRSTGPGLTNGYLKVWVDGFLKIALAGQDNDERTIDVVRLGPGPIPAGVSGVLWFDDYVSRRLTYIGP